MHLDTITRLLDIPNQKVVSMVQYTKERFEFMLEPIAEVSPVCSGCGRVHKTAVHSYAYTVVEDLPMNGKRVFLRVRKRKIRCPEDGKIRVEEFAWLRKRFTKRFAQQVYRLTSITTNKEAGWYLAAVSPVNYADISKSQINSWRKEFGTTKVWFNPDAVAKWYEPNPHGRDSKSVKDRITHWAMLPPCPEI